MSAKVTLLLLSLWPIGSNAGPIADLFRDGVFGVAWGASPAEVEAALPGGKWKRYGDIRMYSVPDGRTVFGIERTPKQQIIFAFSTSERTNGVSVQFPSDMGAKNFGNLLAKSTEVFGPPIRGADAPEPFEYSGGDVGGVTSTQVLWPTDDSITVNIVSGATRTLIAVKFELTLNISYNKIEATTKDQLGLN